MSDVHGQLWSDPKKLTTSQTNATEERHFVVSMIASWRRILGKASRARSFEIDLSRSSSDVDAAEPLGASGTADVTRFCGRDLLVRRGKLTRRLFPVHAHDHFEEVFEGREGVA